jgi:hypothetical protein
LAWDVFASHHELLTRNQVFQEQLTTGAKET